MFHGLANTSNRRFDLDRRQLLTTPCCSPFPFIAGAAGVAAWSSPTGPAGEPGAGHRRISLLFSLFSM
jgi:hypothetical protein